MLSIRIVAAGAIFAVAVGGAQAQTATDSSPGKPIPLLQVLAKPAKTTVRPHLKATAKTEGKSTIRLSRKSTAHSHSVFAHHKTTRVPAQDTAEAAAPANVWPASDTGPTAELPAAVPAAMAPTPSSADSQMSEIVVGGQTVQVSSPQDVNALDLAASTPAAATPATTTPASAMTAVASAAPADNAPIAANTPIAANAPMAAKAEAAPHPASTSIIAMAAQDSSSPIGSLSWIIQMLAGLGGALAAGSVAWFLIGFAPQRKFDESVIASE